MKRTGLALTFSVAFLAAACTGTGTSVDSTTSPSPARTTTSTAPASTVGTSDDLRLAEKFIDAFYSWDPDALTDLPWSSDAYLGQITYYQGWAEGGNYEIIDRQPCEESAGGAICRVTVEDDVLLALGLDFHATDTFQLRIEDGQITAIDTSSDDPELVETATQWLMEQKPELIEGPCEGFFQGGPTPGECVRAVILGFEEFAAADGHPDGRIVFGRITRLDPMYDQIVALHAVDPDGRNLVQLTEDDTAYPAVSPDGNRIAYTLLLPDGSVQIATMAADGSDVQELTTGPGIHAWPTWSPDGSWIAYAYSPTLPDDPNWHTVIHRMDADGSNDELLGESDTFDREPRISPDGTAVLFVRGPLSADPENGEADESVLVVRDVRTGEERVIEAAGTAAYHPSWSPDGEWIIYNIARSLAVERVAADGSGEPAVMTDSTMTRAAFRPSYSPDGGRIVFGCIGPADDDALCLMDADGSNFEILVDEPGVAENHFSWGVTPSKNDG